MTTTLSNMFGRLGIRSDVDTKIAEAEQMLGAMIDEDTDAETVTATLPDYDNEVIFRAIHKGNGAWIVLYNGAFYSRD